MMNGIMTGRSQKRAKPAATTAIEGQANGLESGSSARMEGSAGAGGAGHEGNSVVLMKIEESE